MMNAKSSAFLSWLSDAGATAAVLVLLVAWLADIRAGSAHYLSPSFFDEGFCLSPMFDNTHLTCAGFDIAFGLVFMSVALLIGRGGGANSSKRYFGLAMYLFSHGYGHYVAGTDIVEQEGMSIQELLILSAILSIGPMGGAFCLTEAGKISKRTGNVAAAIGLVVLVGTYTLFIQKPKYALLYINISITGSTALPSMLAIGYTSESDIVVRSKFFTWPKFFANVFVTYVIISEPLFCDSFLSGIGGHLIFDISLLVQAVATIPTLSTTEIKHKIQ